MALSSNHYRSKPINYWFV